MAKIFITKYAFTQGIIEAEAEVKNVDANFGTINGKSTAAYIKNMSSYYGNDFHLTKEEALKHVEIMRLKRIESLKKQIKKMESLKVKFLTR